MKFTSQRLIYLVIFFLIYTAYGYSQQIADPNFHTVIEKPAFTKNHPKVLFDEAHNNFHKTNGNYKPFVDLIKQDGYQVIANKAPFLEKNFKGFDILIIVNALGAPDMDQQGADKPAFTKQECEEVYRWLQSGGSLLFIADHAPMGGAAEILAHRLGVDMSKGFTLDDKHHEADQATAILYSRENGLLIDHPITNGRDASEKLHRIIAFTGQSLKGPANSTTFLQLADSAVDVPDRNSKQTVSAAGRAQGIAFQIGKGHVVVLGEAAMLTAQIVGAEQRPFGMNKPGNDDKQLALNIMHWLAGILGKKGK